MILNISNLPGGAEIHVCGIIFNPGCYQVLIVNNKAYKGKRAGAGVPGGRTDTIALTERLRFMLTKKPGNLTETAERLDNIGLLKKEPETWVEIIHRHFPRKNYEDLEEIFNKLTLLKERLDEGGELCWDDLSLDVKDMLLREKLCVEVHSETGVEKDELEILNFVSCDKRTYSDKVVYRVLYFCVTEAEGIPRKHYKNEVDESRWFNVNHLPAIMYRSHKELFEKPEIDHLVAYWRKRARKKIKHEQIASKEPDHKSLFEWAKR